MRIKAKNPRPNVLRLAGLRVDRFGELTYTPPGCLPVVVRVGRVEAALLLAVGRGPVGVAAAMRRVWGQERCPKAFAQLASRVSAKLDRVGCPAAVGVRRGTVGLRLDFPSTCGSAPR